VSSISIMDRVVMILSKLKYLIIIPSIAVLLYHWRIIVMSICIFTIQMLYSLLELVSAVLELIYATS